MSNMIDADKFLESHIMKILDSNPIPISFLIMDTDDQIKYIIDVLHATLLPFLEGENIVIAKDDYMEDVDLLRLEITRENGDHIYTAYSTISAYMKTLNVLCFDVGHPSFKELSKLMHDDPVQAIINIFLTLLVEMTELEA